MELKISDYFVDGDWHSFIGRAIKECPLEHYNNLLNKYLNLGDSYDIKIAYTDIEPAIDLLVSNYKPNPKNEGFKLHTAIPISYDNRWGNGLNFFNVISKRMPNLITEFINNDKFQEQMSLIILNNNKEVAYAKRENKLFNTFFEKIIAQLNREQFNKLYDKNNLYINGQKTPQIRAILENFHLQHELNKNMDKTSKVAIKI